MTSFIRGVIVVGPIQTDIKKNLTGEGGKLIAALQSEGIKVLYTSSIVKPFIRALDILWKLFIYKSKYNVILLQIFGRRANILEAAITFIGKVFRKKLVLTIHGGAYIEFYEKHPKRNNRILRRADNINTPSTFIQEYLLEKNYKVDYIPNFISTERFSFRREVSNPFSILWVRAFNDIYHPELAIWAFRKVHEKYPQSTLTMVGPDQGKLQLCKELVHSLNLENVIKFTGRIPNDELAFWYHTHQVYINTTRYESFGVALIEAGSCGIPCVSTGAGEIPLLWKDRENILLAERDPDIFAEKILELLTNHDLRTKISNNACKNASSFTWDSIRGKWMQIIDQYA